MIKIKCNDKARKCLIEHADNNKAFLCGYSVRKYMQEWVNYHHARNVKRLVREEFRFIPSDTYRALIDVGASITDAFWVGYRLAQYKYR